CEYCNSRMVFENKGPGNRGGRFLICDRKRRGFECKSVRWRYDDFEASFLTFVQEIDLHELLHEVDQGGRRGEIIAEVDSLRGQLAEAKEQRDRAFDLYVTKVADKEYITERLNLIKARLVQLETALKRKEDELHAETGQLARFYDSKDQIKSLVNRL